MEICAQACSASLKRTLNLSANKHILLSEYKAGIKVFSGTKESLQDPDPECVNLSTTVNKGPGPGKDTQGYLLL
jgi:hypothetical protein